MPDQTHRRRASSRRPSPLNRALTPGSQDDLRGPPSSPEPPLTPLIVGVDLDHQHHQSINQSPITKRQLCAGPPGERVDHQHQDPEELARHLELFLRHSWAPAFVMQYGIAAINQALLELPHTGPLRSPAAWLVARVRALAAGAGPTPRQPTKTEADNQRFQADYERRWGRTDADR